MGQPRLIASLCLLFGLLCLGATVGLMIPKVRAGVNLTSQRSTETLSVLTWNIGHVYLGEYRDSRASDDDIPHVAEIIARTSPDVVALQELRDHKQLESLLIRLGGAYFAGIPSDSDERNDRYAAVLVAGRLGPRFSTITTSTGRALAAAMFSLPGQVGPRRQPWVVLSVHLDAFSPQRRQSQAEEMIDWIDRSELKQVVVAGDFNFDADLVLRYDPNHVDAVLYRFLTSRFEDAAQFGMRTTIVDRRIDYIFFRGPVVRRRTTVIERAGTRLMDHVPLLVELVLGDVGETPSQGSSHESIKTP